MRKHALAFAFTVCALVASSSLAGEQDIRLKEAPGHDVTTSRCAVCHSLDYITMVAPVMNRSAWQQSVRKMIDVFGAPVTDQEASSIIEYLGQHYSGAPTPR
ncbi:hypothetical protein JM946_08760 [Steroidobacter sp. S1-65]|uniref:Sulfite dehydrogenase (Cytochrome) subunit SorB n=1 Tax=Steroidobacter gossypii TaxID=2805490 RepID=A0ABS1WV52_9GAMM|nr:hypothetical protein [Steroidobacter gossypii]MBM0104837.1 hypothetical protein [Steroidobacter gossypii]